jgi:hypothetical protein
MVSVVFKKSWTIFRYVLCNETNDVCYFL